MGKVVRVAQLPKREAKPGDGDRLCEQLCFYYPAYTFAMARRLPAKRVHSMLMTAQAEQAKHYCELVQIATAPHTKDGEGVKTLISKYKGLMRG